MLADWAPTAFILYSWQIQVNQAAGSLKSLFPAMYKYWREIAFLVE